MYLLDTKVVSELRKKGNPKADRHVLAWESSLSGTLMYLSVVTILELELGVLGIGYRDAVQGAILRGWMEERVLKAFAGRVLSVDTQVALRAAALHVPNRRPEHDALIAATAQVHKMTVVTRNTADFACTGVPTLNPWEA